MKFCNGCGGVVGRDCWNPEECAWISEQTRVQQERQVTEDLWGYVHRLEARVAALEAQLPSATTEGP